MAVRIRLTRVGTKKRPFYRIVAADARSPRDGRFIERLGTYSPMLARDDAGRVTLNEERIKHWLAVGAKPSERVERFLGEAGIVPKPPIRERPKKSRPKAKALERMKAAEEAAKNVVPAEVAATEPAADEAVEPAADEAAEPAADEAAEPAADEAAEPAADEAAEPAADEAAEPAAEAAKTAGEDSGDTVDEAAGEKADKAAGDGAGESS